MMKPSAHFGVPQLSGVERRSTSNVACSSFGCSMLRQEIWRHKFRN